MNHRTERPLTLGLKSSFFLATAVLAAALQVCPSAVRAQAAAPVFTSIYSFTLDAGSGASPSAPLLQAADGNFYGTTASGSPDNAGAVFQLTPAGTVTTLHSFDTAAGGDDPNTGLVQGADGSFYGTTDGGSSGLPGTVYKISPAGVLTTLASFPRAVFSTGNLIAAPDGSFYGTTNNGGANFGGTIFQVSASAEFRFVYDFSAESDSEINAEGARPDGTFVLGNDGNYYGTTGEGGPNGTGTVFKFTPPNVVSVVYAFGAVTSDKVNAGGANPQNGLIVGADGNFYGTTASGGANGAGTIFRLTPAGVLTTLHEFDAPDDNRVNHDGTFPVGSLLQATDGNFYGATGGGGPHDTGTVFQLTPDGAFTVVHGFGNTVFDGPNADGAGPETGLIQATDGKLYGTTSTGGKAGQGTVYTLTLPGTTTPPPPPAGTPVVTLTATTPSVGVGSGGSAVFTLALSAAQDHDVVVNFTIKGSGVNGTDYRLLKGTKKIKAGKTSKPIKVIPQGDLGGASKKTVVLILAPGDGYTVGTTGKVKIKITAGQ